jgi:hypothetical protein
MGSVDTEAHRESGKPPLGFIGTIDTGSLMQKTIFFGKSKI